MIDNQGFRANVGIIISNNRGQVLWTKRVNQDAWQFPQGGVKQNESPEQALYRELKEEVGLEPKDVHILACTKHWLKYYIPRHFIRKSYPRCIGQKQKWFLLSLRSSVEQIRFDLTDSPEFDAWSWVNYWYPLSQVISFKKDVYRKALKELHPYFLRNSSYVPNNGSKLVILDSINYQLSDRSKQLCSFQKPED